MIFYSAEQVSKMTGMSVDWLWRQAREGRISHHKLGGRYRWTAEDLMTLAAQSAVAPVLAQDLPAINDSGSRRVLYSRRPLGEGESGRHGRDHTV